MASAEPTARDDAQSFLCHDEAYHKPVDTFEILEQDFENGVLLRHKKSWWTRWSIRARRRNRNEDGEEHDGLLTGRDGLLPRDSEPEIGGSCRWCIYSGNTALGFLYVFLPIINGALAKRISGLCSSCSIFFLDSQLSYNYPSGRVHLLNGASQGQAAKDFLGILTTSCAMWFLYRATRTTTIGERYLSSPRYMLAA